MTIRNVERSGLDFKEISRNLHGETEEIQNLSQDIGVLAETRIKDPNTKLLHGLVCSVGGR